MLKLDDIEEKEALTLHEINVKEEEEEEMEEEEDEDIEETALDEEVPERDWTPAEEKKARWIRGHMKIICDKKSKILERRECTGCGCDIIEHKSWPHENTPLIPRSHVVPTNAYGTLRFTGTTGNTNEFARLHYESPTRDVLHLLNKVWELNSPKLVLSLVGGLHDINKTNVEKSSGLENVLMMGLMKTAAKMGAWVITEGAQSDLSRDAGEAGHRYSSSRAGWRPLVLLGINNWSCLKHKDDLCDKWGKWPGMYAYGTDNYDVRRHVCHQTGGEVSRPESEKLSRDAPQDEDSSPDTDHKILPDIELDPNHSHFLFVDTGSVNCKDAKVEFRARLEAEIKKMKLTEAVNVPVVIVLYGGAALALEKVHTALAAGCQILVVEDSGGLSTILCRLEDFTIPLNIATIWRGVDLAWNQVGRDLFAPLDHGTVKEYLRDMMDYVRHIHILRRTDTTSPSNIEAALLKAIFTGLTVPERVEVLQVWSRPDIAREELFKPDTHWQTGSLDRAALLSLVNNQAEFLRLFLDCGLEIGQFLTPRKLLILYNTLPRDSLVYKLLYDISNGNKFTFRDIGKLVEQLTWETFQSCYYTEDLISLDINSTEESTASLDWPSRDLFIWAVLNHRPELAKILWSLSRSPLISALFAMKVLRSMQDKAKDSQLVTDISKQITHFEELAVTFLTRCYERHVNRTCCLLMRTVESYGYTTTVEMAVASRSELFLAHPAWEAMLTSLSMGNMSDSNSMIKVWSCIFLPFSIYTSIEWGPENITSSVGNRRRATILSKAGHDETDRRESKKHSILRDVEMFRLDASRRVKTTADTAAMDIGQPLKKVYSPQCYESFLWFYKAPLVNLITNTVAYFIFLLLFSGVLLTDFHQGPLSVAEMILVIWVATFILEEIRQALAERGSRVAALKAYLSFVWNLFDILTAVLFILGYTLRLVTCSSCLHAARVVLCLDLILYWTRLLHIFAVHKQLGPKVVMIGKMVIDMLYFLTILMVVLVAYGITLQVLLYPNSSLNFNLIKGVFKKPYWQLYGELFLEELQGEEECSNITGVYEAGILPRCPDEMATHIAPFMLAVYVLIGNILMLNLLIAMFSYTFSKVQDNTDFHWNYQRYLLIKEYHTRPPFPPPLIIISHVWRLVVAVIRLTWEKYFLLDPDAEFKMVLTDTKSKALNYWEGELMQEFLIEIESVGQNPLENRMKKISNRLDKLTVILRDMENQTNERRRLSHMGSTLDEVPTFQPGLLYESLTP